MESTRATSKIVDSTNAEDLAKLVEDSLNEIYVFDTDTLLFLRVNKQARANLGYSMDELSRLTPIDIKPEIDEAQFRAIIAPVIIKPSQKIIFEAVHQRKDSSTYPVEVHLQGGMYAGRKILSAIILDITERKQLQEEHRLFELQMQEAQKLESLGVLAGGIAHDFNNILTSILGYADLARISCQPDSQTYQYLEQLLKGATRGAELIKQMLAYSGKGKFMVGKTNIEELITEIAELLEVSITKNCKLQFYFDDEIASIDADATQLRQVILNLILNASEAIGEKQGLITVKAGNIYANQKYLSMTYLEKDLEEGNYVYLEVSDSGNGMDETIIKKIFEPFYTTKFTGRGLGLSAIMGIVKGHKGTLKVYSEPGKGTSFKILFPASEGPDILLKPKAGVAPVESHSGLVLIIDDEQQVRDIATDMLVLLGFTVITASDGMEGLSIFEERHKELKLVLLDMTMPRMDGASAFMEMRHLDAKVPTILSSGYNEQITINQFAGKGLAGFLQKPYTYNSLVAEVDKVLMKTKTE